jgi:hypothetical protein
MLQRVVSSYRAKLKQLVHEACPPGCKAPNDRVAVAVQGGTPPLILVSPREALALRSAGSAHRGTHRVGVACAAIGKTVVGELVELGRCAPFETLRAAASAVQILYGAGPGT